MPSSSSHQRAAAANSDGDDDSEDPSNISRMTSFNRSSKSRLNVRGAPSAAMDEEVEVLAILYSRLELFCISCRLSSGRSESGL